MLLPPLTRESCNVDSNMYISGSFCLLCLAVKVVKARKVSTLL